MWEGAIAGGIVWTVWSFAMGMLIGGGGAILATLVAGWLYRE